MRVVKQKAVKKFVSAYRPKILNVGTPQNECMPMAGTFASTMRKISSFLNAWNTAPTVMVFFGFLITITFISSSSSLMGICFIFPECVVLFMMRDSANKDGKFEHFMSKSISNFPLRKFSISVKRNMIFSITAFCWTSLRFELTSFTGNNEKQGKVWVAFSFTK